jgi:dolichyl-phosphate beta-glucosyltransferase
MYFQLKRRLITRTERKLHNKIVIVVPCFNEAKRLDLLYFKKLSEIRNTVWIFVDDGSTDDTSKILIEYGKKENIIHVKTNDNVGKSNAVAYGMNYAAKNISHIGWLGFLDADGAFATGDVESIIKMTSQFESYDALYTSRVKMAGRNIERNNARHIIARLITSIFGLVWKDIPYDTQSGFKLYRYYDNFNLMLTKSFKTRWFLDIELYIRFLHSREKNIRVWEEPVSSWIDIPGSKIDYRQSTRIILEAMYIFYLLLNQRRKPLKN